MTDQVKVKFDCQQNSAIRYLYEREKQKLEKEIKDKKMMFALSLKKPWDKYEDKKDELKTINAMNEVIFELMEYSKQIKNLEEEVEKLVIQIDILNEAYFR